MYAPQDDGASVDVLDFSVDVSPSIPKRRRALLQDEDRDDDSDHGGDDYNGDYNGDYDDSDDADGPSDGEDVTPSGLVPPQAPSHHLGLPPSVCNTSLLINSLLLIYVNVVNLNIKNMMVQPDLHHCLMPRACDPTTIMTASLLARLALAMSSTASTTRCNAEHLHVPKHCPRFELPFASAIYINSDPLID